MMADEPQTFPSVADCELRYAAALRRRDETKAELLAKYRTLSILALPRDEHQVMKPINVYAKTDTTSVADLLRLAWGVEIR